jgi:hypothetical protein
MRRPRMVTVTVVTSATAARDGPEVSGARARPGDALAPAEAGVRPRRARGHQRIGFTFAGVAAGS